MLFFWRNETIWNTLISRHVYVCVFCLPQWIALLWPWISLAALPGCLAEEAWPTLAWPSFGFSCSLPAPTSAGSGPSTRLSSEFSEPATSRTFLFSVEMLWNRVIEVCFSKQSLLWCDSINVRCHLWTQWWSESFHLCNTEPLHHSTIHIFTSLWSWLM